ncbi:MAG: carboxypeptidase regulatory-like domain-containing protein [Planctomycetaceae bacterium]|nr:carboxypeptidase regulatory-like domain-containing protein [Planctomycetaceae bacterium]
MLLGYLSDEHFVAISGAQVELTRGDESLATVSRASGSIHAEISGRWKMTVNAPGFGARHYELDVSPQYQPVQFRLLSSRLAGYMWPKTVPAGGTSEYCINSPEGFRLDLYHYGWEKKFIRSYGWCDEHGPQAMRQLLPTGDFTQTGCQWNRTGYNLEYQRHGITAPEQSGLYGLHLSTMSGEFLSIPWLVTPRKPQEKLAVLASTLSWNAYNSWGGRSNYFHQAGLPDRPVVCSRQDVGRYTDPDLWPFAEDETGRPLSFERPEPAAHIPQQAKITDTIPGRTASCFAPGLWRQVGWLEREGIPFDLWPETALEFGDFALEDYKVLMLDNHPEYCTGQMYHRLKTWVRERGGRLIYPGGCGFLCEVEFDSRDVVRCRQECLSTQRGESEAHLLGVAYSHAGFQSAAPYQVKQADHWVFAGTSLQNGDLFGHASLHERCPGGASGHELDQIVAESPAGLSHLARGTNSAEAGADLVLYETESGGAVFSAGSLCWTLALPIDQHVSTITANVLQRFLGG